MMSHFHGSRQQLFLLRSSLERASSVELAWDSTHLRRVEPETGGFCDATWAMIWYILTSDGEDACPTNVATWDMHERRKALLYVINSKISKNQAERMHTCCVRVAEESWKNWKGWKRGKKNRKWLIKTFGTCKARVKRKNITFLPRKEPYNILSIFITTSFFSLRTSFTPSNFLALFFFFLTRNILYNLAHPKPGRARS